MTKGRATITVFRGANDKTGFPAEIGSVEILDAENRGWVDVYLLPVKAFRVHFALDEIQPNRPETPTDQNDEEPAF